MRFLDINVKSVTMLDRDRLGSDCAAVRKC